MKKTICSLFVVVIVPGVVLADLTLTIATRRDDTGLRYKWTQGWVTLAEFESAFTNQSTSTHLNTELTLQLQLVDAKAIEAFDFFALLRKLKFKYAKLILFVHTPEKGAKPDIRRLNIDFTTQDDLQVKMLLDKLDQTLIQEKASPQQPPLN